MSAPGRTNGVEYLQYSTLKGSSAGLGLIASTSGAVEFQNFERELDKRLGDLRNPSYPDLVFAVAQSGAEPLIMAYSHINSYTTDKGGRLYPSRSYYFLRSGAESAVLPDLLAALRTPEVRTQAAIKELVTLACNIPEDSQIGESPMWALYYQAMVAGHPCVVLPRVVAQDQAILPLEGHAQVQDLLAFLRILPRPVLEMVSVLIVRRPTAQTRDRSTTETFTLYLEAGEDEVSNHDPEPKLDIFRWPIDQTSKVAMVEVPLPLSANDAMQIRGGWFETYVEVNRQNRTSSQLIAKGLARVRSEVERRRATTALVEGGERDDCLIFEFEPTRDYADKVELLNLRIPELLFRDAMLFLSYGKGSVAEKITILEQALSNSVLQVAELKLFNLVCESVQRELKSADSATIDLIGRGPYLRLATHSPERIPLGHETAVEVMANWTAVKYADLQKCMPRLEHWLNDNRVSDRRVSEDLIRRTRALYEGLPDMLDGTLTAEQAHELVRSFSTAPPAQVVNVAASKIDTAGMVDLIKDDRSSRQSLFEAWAPGCLESVSSGRGDADHLRTLLVLTAGTKYGKRFAEELCDSLSNALERTRTRDLLLLCLHSPLRSSTKGQQLFNRVCEHSSHGPKLLEVYPPPPVQLKTDVAELLELPSVVFDPYLQQPVILDRTLDAIEQGHLPVRLLNDGWSKLLLGDPTDRRYDPLISLGRLLRVASWSGLHSISPTPAVLSDSAQAIAQMIGKGVDRISQERLISTMQCFVELVKVDSTFSIDAQYDLFKVFDRCFSRAIHELPADTVSDFCISVIDATDRHTSRSAWRIQALAVMHICESLSKRSPIEFHRKVQRLRARLKK